MMLPNEYPLFEMYQHEALDQNQLIELIPFRLSLRDYLQLHLSYLEAAES